MLLHANTLLHDITCNLAAFLNWLTFTYILTEPQSSTGLQLFVWELEQIENDKAVDWGYSVKNVFLNVYTW